MLNELLNVPVKGGGYPHHLKRGRMQRVGKRAYFSQKPLNQGTVLRDQFGVMRLECISVPLQKSYIDRQRSQQLSRAVVQLESNATPFFILRLQGSPEESAQFIPGLLKFSGALLDSRLEFLSKPFVVGYFVSRARAFCCHRATARSRSSSPFNAA